MILYGFFNERRILISHELIVDTDAVVSQSLAMAIVDALTDLKKLLIIFYGLLIFLDIVIEDSNRIVCSSLISELASPPASESQHFIILEAAHGGYINPIIHFFLI